jgi:hypothetical protein
MARKPASNGMREQVAFLSERLAQMERLLADQREQMALQNERMDDLIVLLEEQSARSTPHADPQPRASAIADAPAVTTIPAGEPARTAATGERPKARRSRRALLKLGGTAAAAGVAAVVVGNSTAQAHSAAATQTYMASGPGNVAVEGDGTSGAKGVRGTSDATGVPLGSTSVGVEGIGTTGAIGVRATSDSYFAVAAESVNNIAVRAISTATSPFIASVGGSVGVSGKGDSYGGTFAGGQAALKLEPVAPAGVPSSNSNPGELIVDIANNWWVPSIAGMTSGWMKLVGLSGNSHGGAINFLSAPIRVADTRPGQPVIQPTPKLPLPPFSTTEIYAASAITGSTGPSGIVGVFGNLTVTNTQGAGDLIVWPPNAPQPLSSNINYVAGQTIANFAFFALSPQGSFNVYVHGAATDFIFDLAGWVM